MRKYPFTLRLAEPGEEVEIRALISEAAEWLGQSKNTDQWQHPWPDRAGQQERIRNDITRGKTWLVWDGTAAAATITIDSCEPLDLEDRPIWPNELRWEPALYVRRVVVGRRYATTGLGAALMDWAAAVAKRDHCAELIRLDVWTTNTRLHAYYEGLRFTRCPSAEGLSNYPSQALFERRADQSGSDSERFFREMARQCDRPAGM